MKFAYADPPYLGCSKRLYGDHPEAWVYDTIEGHQALIDKIQQYDGYAYSCTSGNLHLILPLFERDARIGAWVKPFCAMKGVSPAYAWEPVIFRTPRKKWEAGLRRDWVSASITMKRTCKGAKPLAFCFWLFDEILGMTREDGFDDLFPGSGAVKKAYTAWCNRAPRLMKAV